MSPTSGGEPQSAPDVDIHVAAQGNRAALEGLYLELREMAKRNGLKIEFKLDTTGPGEPPAR